MPNLGPLELLLLLTLVGWVPATVVCGMKGRWVWLALGLLLWLPSFVGALLPAQPGSSWARRA